MFRDSRMWHDALRIAEDYLPGKVQEIQMELASGEGGGVGRGCWGGVRDAHLPPFLPPIFPPFPFSPLISPLPPLPPPPPCRQQRLFRPQLRRRQRGRRHRQGTQVRAGQRLRARHRGLPLPHRRRLAQPRHPTAVLGAGGQPGAELPAAPPARRGGHREPTAARDPALCGGGGAA